MTSAQINFASTASDRAVPRCSSCLLRKLPGSCEFSDSELAFMEDFKTSHGRAWSGQILVQEGQRQPALYTLFSGWAMSYRTFPGGQRQILGVHLKGDLLGLDTVLCGDSYCTVEAVTDITFCVLDHRQMDKLFRDKAMARRLAVAQAEQTRRMTTRLAVRGALDAPQNLAYFILELFADSRRSTCTGFCGRCEAKDYCLWSADGLRSGTTSVCFASLN